MAYVTRAMRERAADDRREARIGKELQTMRQLDSAFFQQALTDRMAKWPMVTIETIEEQLAYQNRRVDEQRAESKVYQACLAVAMRDNKESR